MSKFIFLDRDGTIIKDKPYMSDPKEIEFLPEALEGLNKFRDSGYKFIIISNQAGIARKYYDLEKVNRFNSDLLAKLSIQRIKIEKIYICPHHPALTGPCKCRKPGTEMAELAASEFDIKLDEALYIGDKDCDIELGKNCGGKTFLIDNNQYQTEVKPDYKVKTILEAYEVTTKIL